MNLTLPFALAGAVEPVRPVPAQPDGPRPPETCDAILIGGEDSYTSRVVELTREGIALEILDPGFAHLRDPRDLASFSEGVLARFRWGVMIWFPGARVRVRAVVQRAFKAEYGPEAPLQLACRFTQPLNRAQSEALGLA